MPISPRQTSSTMSIHALTPSDHHTHTKKHSSHPSPNFLLISPGPSHTHRPFIHSHRDLAIPLIHSPPPNLLSPILNPTAHNPFVQWTTSRRKTADPLARVSRVSQLPHVTPSEQLDTGLLITAAVFSHRTGYTRIVLVSSCCESASTFFTQSQSSNK